MKDYDKQRPRTPKPWSWDRRLRCMTCSIDRVNTPLYCGRIYVYSHTIHLWNLDHNRPYSLQTHTTMAHTKKTIAILGATGQQVGVTACVRLALLANNHN